MVWRFWLRSHALSSIRVLPFSLFATLPFFTSRRFFHSINKTNSSTITIIERTTQRRTDPLSRTRLSAALLENCICLRWVRVHRCHHPRVERGGENDEFELPFGFPEVIQHVQDTPEYVRDLTYKILCTKVI
jgi:hypothetical protein